MPYAHKYANAVTDHGMIGAVTHFMPEDGHAEDRAAGAACRWRARTSRGWPRSSIDMEMKMFRGLETPVIFLQNVVVDLLLGMGMKDAFRIFHDYVREKYDAEPGFITMNLPMLLDTLDAVGIENPIVCANINKIGFRVSGGHRRLHGHCCEPGGSAPSRCRCFASGAIPPREAIEWVAAQEGVDSIVFGASSRKNIRDTKGIVDRAYQ